MSTIERLKLSGSPLRLLTSTTSPNYSRTTSFLKSTVDSSTAVQSSQGEYESFRTSSPIKGNKVNGTTWKLNPRKLDSLKVRRNSRHNDDEDEDDDNNGQQALDTYNCIQEINIKVDSPTSSKGKHRPRHSSDSDLSKEHNDEKKLSSFFQTEV